MPVGHNVVMVKQAEHPESVVSAISACHRLLEGRALTSGELRRKLAQRGFVADAIDAAIERCVDALLIDDAAYAHTFVRQRLARGYGDQRIRHDLAQRGIDVSLTNEALFSEARGVSAEDACMTLLERRFSADALHDVKARAKAFRYLVSRGHTSSDADRAISRLRDAHADH